MAAIELVLRKQERTIGISDQEVSYYERKHHQLETEIATIRGEIVSLEEALVQERRLREHKDAYDAMAREIFKYPPRSDLQRSIDEVERELAQIASEQSTIQQYIDSRAESVFDIVQSLKQLKRQVEVDLKSL